MSSQSILMERRHFLSAAGAAFLTGISGKSVEALQRADAVFASAYRAEDGRHGIAILSDAGSLIHQYKLPARGHDVVFRPKSEQMVAFARRPGTFAAVIDRSSQKTGLIDAPAGRHFYGHGCFSADGQLLFSTENDFDNERGIVGIFDARAGYKRIGEYNSYGVGPHEILYLPAHNMLAVANGGILTHPEFPRTKLNLSTMKPNLSFVDANSGGLISKVELPRSLHKLSIRHLAVMRDRVWFACQNEGDFSLIKPLVGSVSISHGDYSMLEMPETYIARLRGYVGSIAANPEDGRLAITSPRGGVFMQIDPRSGSISSVSDQTDVCGIAPAGKGFVTSTGTGNFNGDPGRLFWDNHIAALGGNSA